VFRGGGARGARSDCMITLAELTAAMAEHIAHTRGWSGNGATRWIERQLADAHEAYRVLGAPLGDTDEGFVAWLQPRYEPPTA
jgi:hypothetical protein